MLHVGFRAMHESMTSQKIKKLGAGGAKLGGGGAKLLVGGHGPPGPPLATGLSRQLTWTVVMMTVIRGNRGFRTVIEPNITPIAVMR